MLTRLPQAEQWMTVRDVAEKYRVSDQKIYNLIKQGAITVIRIGRCVRVPLSEACALAGVFSDYDPADSVESGRPLAHVANGANRR